MSVDEAATYKKALERERQARQLAERLLEDKSREVFTQYDELRRQSAEMQLFLSIAQIRESELNFEDTLTAYLQAVCRMTQWPVGHVYVLSDQNSDLLVPSGIWYLQDEHRFTSFREITQGTTFERGSGLPGRVLDSGESAWIVDVTKDPNFPRNKAMNELGVRGGFAVPIVVFGKTLAVAEFFTPDAVDADERYLRIVAAAAGNVSHAIERQTSAQILKRKNRELEEALINLKNTQAQLVQSEKMASLGVLAAGVAHELNNPISYIVSNLAVLGDYARDLKRMLVAVDELFSRCETISDLSVAQEEAKRIARLQEEIGFDFIISDLVSIVSQSNEGAQRVKEIVKNLKEFAHVDQLEIKSYDINDGIRSSLRIAWNELKYKCEVRECYGTIPAISCFPQQLNQVFLNLIVNAGQAIEDKGIVGLSTWDDDVNVYFQVEDTGSGIPPEHLKKIFDPFYTTKPIGKGTGLGLSVVHEIVRNHGGNIVVDSTVGKGTRFKVTLPKNGGASGDSQQARRLDSR